jgi:hypothetical protein
VTSSQQDLSDKVSTEEVINRMFGNQRTQYGLTEFLDLGEDPIMEKLGSLSRITFNIKQKQITVEAKK